MSISCPQCTALHWLEERLKEHPSTKQNHLFNIYCNQGDVSIPLMQPLPPLLHSLLYDSTNTSNHFRTHIRKYNSALAFVSLKYHADSRTVGGIQCFQIHGALYHLTGPLIHSSTQKNFHLFKTETVSYSTFFCNDS
ncbi:hypothetical protein EV426DRAFT_91467 [Tirmania nivea]|nr:hypothetical protein EV426DRAFT_91467 [Tirmania nivea]